MRILIVEDDPVLADGLTRSLRHADYAVDCVNKGDEADHVLAAQSYDLVILDVGLPGLDGFEVLRRLRRRGGAVPVLVLTARDALPDRVRGLDLGADDYMVKPFDLPELEARVRALIRRGQSGGASLLTHGALVLDTAGRRATLGGEPLDLSARELGVLEVLMMRSGRVVNKEQLAEQLYGWDEEVGANAIEVYVHRLRRKLEPAGVSIRTIRGLGYLLEKGRQPEHRHAQRSRAKPTTLRRQVLMWLCWPLLVLWSVSSVIDYDIANRFVNLAYDRSLLESRSTSAARSRCSTSVSTSTCRDSRADAAVARVRAPLLSRHRPESRVHHRRARPAAAARPLFRSG
jgi:two-component system OmpR family response regulator